MVSKTILACLAVLACISMTSGTSQGPNFSYCVSGVGYINKKFSLGFAIDSLLGGILNLVGNILSGVLGFVDGLLGSLLGGGNRQVPFIAGPSNIQGLAGILYKVGPVFGKLVQPAFGAGFDSNIFADVHGALSLNILNILKLDLGNASFLKNAVSLSIAQQKAAKIQALLQANRFRSGAWAKFAALLNDYLSVVNQKNININLYVQATLKYIKVQIALLQMAGYPDVDNYVSAMVDTCNKVFSQIGYSGSFGAQDFVVSGIPSDCKCFQ